MYVFFLLSGRPSNEIYTLSLHDALPISPAATPAVCRVVIPVAASAAIRAAATPAAAFPVRGDTPAGFRSRDRKSTRLNSSHANISYAVFCLKKKKQQTYNPKNTHQRQTE